MAEPLPGIAATFVDVRTPSPPDVVLEVEKRLRDIVKKPGNDRCAECLGTPVTAISFNLGILVCAKCEEVHDEYLSAHVSCTLPCDDTRLGMETSWVHLRGARTVVEYVDFMGNDKSNMFWEYSYPPTSVRAAEGSEGSFEKPSSESDRKPRENWVQAKYVENVCCNVYRRRITLRKGKKVRKLWGQLGSTELLVFESEKAAQPSETISLKSGIIRPYIDSSGILEAIDLQTPQTVLTLTGDDRCEIFEWMFALHRTNCNVLPKREHSLKNIPVRQPKKRSQIKAKFRSIPSARDLTQKKRRETSEKISVIDRGRPVDTSTGSKQDTRRGSSTTDDSASKFSRFPKAVEMEDLLHNTTKQELSHLTQEKEKVAGAISDFELRRRKLQKKLQACEQTLNSLYEEERIIDKKLKSLDHSLSQWDEAAKGGVELLELLCKETEPISVEEEGDSHLLEMEDGEVTSGCLRDLLDILTHPEYCKPSYRAAFLLTYQSFTEPLYLLSMLFARFSMTDNQILQMIQTDTFLQGLPKEEQKKIYNILKQTPGKRHATSHSNLPFHKKSSTSVNISAVAKGGASSRHERAPRSARLSTPSAGDLNSRHRKSASVDIQNESTGGGKGAKKVKTRHGKTRQATSVTVRSGSDSKGRLGRMRRVGAPPPVPALA
eukprot:CAMPEP_0119148046 /NCGR_PEP_ID=MMETSP1310-20130426/41259_1 /TAXON_ID=464262 /ORGANISM="Genus nov. species nov., Strain RCC2339" /LENGTH=661 /DNA_ID=CAMNT_0007140053 /DNA_START=8 /DNA_END=1990 /DNA_ORIENTATION=+